jgi:hypothetical protein
MTSDAFEQGHWREEEGMLGEECVARMALLVGLAVSLGACTASKPKID